MNKIVITGGHHTSALPVIEEAKHRHPKVKIYWFGHKRTLAGSKNPTLEYHEIKSLGIPFYNLQAGKFYKTYNIFRLLKIPLGFFQSFFWLSQIKPDVILSFGGYLAVPVVLSGWVLRIPSLAHEQTVAGGYSNRLVSYFVNKVMYTWPQSLKYLPKENSVLVGLPLREDIFNDDGKEFSAENELPTIFILAGKTGAHVINMEILNVLHQLLRFTNVMHQTGDHSGYKDFERLTKEYEKIKSKVRGVYFARKFIYKNEIGSAFGRADVVISRAGAHTCMELMALNKVCILIPIPWVSHNEQYKNAEVVVKAGLGTVFEQDDLSKGSKLIQEIKRVIKDIDQYKLDNPPEIKQNSAKLIVDEIEKVIKKTKKG